MMEVVLSDQRIRELEDIYDKLQKEYERVAGELVFSCSGCPDNCCDSYFLHHTYTEWAYLWLGIRQLTQARRQALVARSLTWSEQCAHAIGAGRRPQLMCPLNEQGRCLLYKYRLLVCRTHGVPATMLRPDGRLLSFPGCFRCQEIVDSRPQQEQPPPHVARTMLLRELARLENEVLDNKRHLLPKVKMTIAEMVIKGPPFIPKTNCEK